MTETTTPTRIVFCITDLDPGGAERALVEIVSRLDRNRWTPAVISLQPGGMLGRRLEQLGIEVHSLNVRSRGDVFSVWRLARLLRRLRPTILQTFLHHANLVGRFAAWLAGVPIVVSGIRVAERRSGWRLRLDRWTGGLVTRHVCVSEAVARFSIEQGGLPAEKIVVIGNGVDLRRFAEAAPADLSEFGIPRDAFVAISVGRLDVQKGSDVLLEAAERLFPTQPGLHVLYTGDGPLRGGLEQAARRSEFGDRIHFAGWREDVPALLRASSAFVLASRWEGMPNAVLEAMAAGLAVVAADVEGLRELIDDGVQGLIVPAGDPGALASGLRRLIEDPAAARNLAENAQAKVSQEFTWDRAAAEYAALFESLCG